MPRRDFPTQVASSVPFDNTSNRFVSTDTQAAIEEVRTPPNGGSGVTPPFMFSKSGGTSAGNYLYVGQVVSSKTGQYIPGTNNIVKLTVSTSANVATNTTIQLQRRTAVATFIDIPLALVVIPAGTYKAEVTFSPSVAIGPDWEIACYNKAGSTVQDAIVLMFMVPV
jgi:hypothetical protein